MAKFIIRRAFLLIFTMLLVSVVVFLITELSPGNLAKNILGAFITQEQEASFLAQLGMDKPFYIRYTFWLLGSDWYASRRASLPMKRITSEDKYTEWWAVRDDGALIRWRYDGKKLVAIVKLVTVKAISEYEDNGRWQPNESGANFFIGVDEKNRMVLWKKDSGPTEYIPLKKGLLRGDPGVSLRTGRPVSESIFVRLRNSMVLAGIAFVLAMPLALFLGMLAGLKEGSLRDRVLSIGSMIFTVTPEFAMGIFLILIMSVWLGLVPGAAVFGEKAPWQRPDMLILPVLTLTLIELGYVLRITRASMVEVMKSPYIRTAYLKGLPYWRIVFKHAVRNALMAPVTVIMLHVNWLMGGIVIVEVVFGYPGLGMYLLASAMCKDVNALEAGAMILVAIAVVTQLTADIIYTFLNPRIHFA